MSIVDKAVAAVTPPESEDDRARATSAARAAASPGDWLSMALDHHDDIRMAFDDALNAPVESRMMAFRELASVLNGHSIAEEIVLYPALAKAHEKGHAMQAYTEQTAAKMQMAELERIDPADEGWREKLEHIRGAVLHHMYEEEKDWFLELKRAGDTPMLTSRYREEFTRYVEGPMVQ